MDAVLGYLRTWLANPTMYQRAQLLCDAYAYILMSHRVGQWRFTPGRRRGNEARPMYCALAATPFSTDDWFVLRAVESTGGFAVGFCPDYGNNSPHCNERRRRLSETLTAMERNHLLLAYAPFPRAAKPHQPHAYKGFEWKIDYVPSGPELAQLYVRIVSEWEPLFAKLTSQ